MTNQTQPNTESTSEPRQPESGTELAAAPTKRQRTPRKGKADPKTPSARSRARPKAERKPAPAAKTARAGTKAAQILDLLKRPHGASLKELQSNRLAAAFDPRIPVGYPQKDGLEGDIDQE